MAAPLFEALIRCRPAPVEPLVQIEETACFLGPPDGSPPLAQATYRYREVPGHMIDRLRTWRSLLRKKASTHQPGACERAVIPGDGSVTRL